MYAPQATRYDGRMNYVRCGNSGLKLSAISLGLWQNFGGVDVFANAEAMVHTAFDLGITHFDLANLYGPPPGSAEENFSRIFHRDLAAHRDELVISTKAGSGMHAGPYGRGGSRKTLIAGCDASLKRLKLDYVDIFYHHIEDTESPLEETVAALADIVKSGKALYLGLSNYHAERFADAVRMLRELGTPCLINQFRYNLLTRGPETDGSFEVMKNEGVGAIVFSPLAQGILSNRYRDGIPADSRAARTPKLKEFLEDPAIQAKLGKLHQLAAARGQTLSQMAIAWLLHQPLITSALIGASSPEQVIELAKSQANTAFSADEEKTIETLTADARTKFHFLTM
ncbi:MAG: aldo/keto reductase [Victivallaceae bacterium]